MVIWLDLSIQKSLIYLKLAEFFQNFDLNVYNAYA